MTLRGGRMCYRAELMTGFSGRLLLARCLVQSVCALSLRGDDRRSAFVGILLEVGRLGGFSALLIFVKCKQRCWEFQNMAIQGHYPSSRSCAELVSIPE